MFTREQTLDLAARAWTQEPGREHRWRAPAGSIIDLLPVGPNVLAVRRMVWPASQFVMSLVGFEHVFARSVLVEIAPEVRFKVAPPPVIAILKIVAFLDDPHGRRKDLDDLRLLLRRYEERSGRLFSDDVFAAGIQDYECANAFLLGLDTGAIATDGDAKVVYQFLKRHEIPAIELEELDPDDLPQRETLRFHMGLKAFRKGFETGRQRETR